MSKGIVSASRSGGQARGRRRPLTTAVLLLALPLAWLLHSAAFRVPGLVERWYAQGLYPRVARALGAVNGLLPWSFGEIVIVAGAVALIGWLGRVWRGHRSGRLVRVGLAAWGFAGIAALAFLLLWGLNYARPPLAERLQLNAADVTLDEIEQLTVQAARAAATSRALAGVRPDFAALDRRVDDGYAALALPGDAIRFATSPAKRPVLALAMSRLGIAGVFNPFTGEPTVNGDLPPSSLPLALAHEKAHQRGITDEGEANLAATLVCLRAEDPWIRYSAQLDLAARGVGALAADSPEAAAQAWRLLGAAAHDDLRQVREFWERHRGAVSKAAHRVNDAYLRSQHVAGGVRSYDRVLGLAVAAARAGMLPLQEATEPAAQLLDADREFARDTALDGVEGWVRWFAPDGEMVRAAGTPVHGHDAIRAAMASAFETPGFRLEWDPERAEISASGDLGVTYGSFRESRLVDGESRVVRRGRYMTVWKRQEDGAWRVLMDIGTDAPPAE